MLKVSIAVIVVVTTQSIIASGCSDLLQCLSDNGAPWTGNVPDRFNIDTALYKDFYRFLCNNRDPYIQCEVNNRTTVRYCSVLTGSGLVAGTYEQYAKIMTFTCQIVDGLVDGAYCMAQDEIRSDIQACFGIFRQQWSQGITEQNESYYNSYCRLIHDWTSCRVDLMLETCSQSSTVALNVWDKAQSDTYCGVLGQANANLISCLALLYGLFSAFLLA